MNSVAVSMIAGLLISFAAVPAFSVTQVSREEIEAIKDKRAYIEKAAEQQGLQKQEDEKTYWYEKMDVAIGATGVLQSSSGATERVSAEGDITEASLSIDLELYIPVSENDCFYMLFESGAGDGIDGDIPALSGFNDDADDNQNLRPSEVWYEHIWCDNRVRIRGGKIDLTTDFDTNAVSNSETDQFLSTGFVNNVAVEFPNDNGAGAMIWVAPVDSWEIGIGAADADGDWDSALDDIFTITEISFSPRFTDRKGNYRIYGWLNGTDHEHLLDSSKTDAHNYGFGLSFDQEVLEFLTIFTRYGWQCGSVSQIEHAFSAGFQFTGNPYGRESDAFGMAYGMAVPGDDWKELKRSNGNNPGNEHHLEIYYTVKMNDHLNVSPDVQWVRNGNGDRASDDLWVFGIRAQLSF
ncbi:MAG: carbohydrate porin [Syntrophales bacterium]|jgi:carbohydrate-selective porin OprB|nr:carbohydrate porin [Syntrophales bacterium]MDY0045258.1 carbohydrate porin [Syntrophales bacterium]